MLLPRTTERPVREPRSKTAVELERGEYGVNVLDLAERQALKPRTCLPEHRQA